MYDGKTLFKQMKKIQENRSRYYFSSTDIVMLAWDGGWKPYDYVAARQPQYRL